MTATDDLTNRVQEARVCRTYDGATHENTLVPHEIGWLAVRIYFHREPIEDLEVEFCACRDNETSGAVIGEVVRSDESGIAKLTFPVPVGNYMCRIEHQEPTVVTTVASVDAPVDLVLPIGRPYFDFEGDWEVDEEDAGQV